jgi:hypothetical protein
MTNIEFAKIVLDACIEYNGSITSWKRTALHNKAVGGVPTSKHITGFAFDIVCDKKTDEPKLIHGLLESDFKAFFDKDHVHVECPDTLISKPV